MDQLNTKELKQNEFPLDEGVNYKQGMTYVWSDGEKIIIKNRSGIRWVKENVDRIFGLGEWEKIRHVAYSEHEYTPVATSPVRAYECYSGYIPQRVIDDLKETLPEEDERKAALEALKEATKHD